MPFIICASQPLCNQQIDDIDRIDLSQYKFTLNTKIIDISEIQLNSVFRHYFDRISLRRLIQLQQSTKLHYRTYYMKQEDWCNNKYHPIHS